MSVGSDPAPASAGGDRPSAGDVPTESYLRSVEDLLGLLLEEVPFADLLDQVLDLVVRAIPVADGVAITVQRANGRTDTAAASDPAARELDEVQRDLGEGPCVDTMRSGQEHLVVDLRSDERWGADLRDAAERLGLVSVLAVPLRAGDVAIGALNVFSATPGGIDDRAHEVARGIAAPVAATLANARAYHRVEQLGGQLREALGTRAVIEQAKGILMVRASCDEAEAFAMLRRTSQHQNRKLRDVAASVVAMRERLPDREVPRPQG